MLPLMLALVAGFDQTPWAHFSRTPYLRGEAETVEIGSDNRDRAAGFSFMLKLTRQKRGAQPVTLWADSTSCPAIRPIVAGMAKLTMPQPAPVGMPGASQTVIVDGTEYELSAPSTDVMGALTIKSNEGSPLSAWVDDALKKLDRCWVASAPR